MAKEIKVGLTNEVKTTVTEANIASTMGSGCLRVFATPAMCCLMEKAASDLIKWEPHTRDFSRELGDQASQRI